MFPHRIMRTAWAEAATGRNGHVHRWLNSRIARSQCGLYWRPSGCSLIDQRMTNRANASKSANRSGEVATHCRDALLRVRCDGQPEGCPYRTAFIPCDPIENLMRLVTTQVGDSPLKLTGFGIGCPVDSELPFPQRFEGESHFQSILLSVCTCVGTS